MTTNKYFSQYLDLDVAPILQSVPVDQRGQAVAEAIKNTTWYNYEDKVINPPVVKRIVNKLEKANRRSFPSVYGEFKAYADEHNIWINEQ